MHLDEAVHCHKDGEGKKHKRGEEGEKNERITGVMGWTKRYGREPREKNANDCVGGRQRSRDGAEQRVSAGIKMTCCGGGGNMETAWDIFKQTSSALFWNTTRSQIIPRWL